MLSLFRMEMRRKLIGAALLAALVPAAWAQQAQRPATIDGKPNFNGLWQTLNTANYDLEAHSAQDMGLRFHGMGAIASIPAGKSVITGDGKIPYLPAAKEVRFKNKTGAPEMDNEAKCYMLGIPRYTYSGMPFQIFQGNADQDLLMVYPFDAGHRPIFMKDKEEPVIETWMGKSMGAWEGNTLVVTTVGQLDKTWLDRSGNHHSDQLKVTERFSLIDADHIRYEATLEDPKTYSRPWTISMPLYRIIDQDAQLLEHKCVAFADKLLYSDLMGLTGPKVQESK
jgi:hypothetical protein